jgi:hypothetical protein
LRDGPFSERVAAALDRQSVAQFAGKGKCPAASRDCALDRALV